MKISVEFMTYIKLEGNFRIEAHLQTNAQKARPSRHEVVILSTRTSSYSSIIRRHQCSSAFVPRFSPIWLVFFNKIFYLSFECLCSVQINRTFMRLCDTLLFSIQLNHSAWVVYKYWDELFLFTALCVYSRAELKLIFIVILRRFVIIVLSFV